MRDVGVKTARTNDFKRPISVLPAIQTLVQVPSVGDAFVVESALTTIACLVVDLLDNCELVGIVTDKLLFYNLATGNASTKLHPVSAVSASRFQGSDPTTMVLFSGCNPARVVPVNATVVGYDASKVGESSPAQSPQFIDGSSFVFACLVVGTLALRGWHNIGGQTLVEAADGSSSGIQVQEGMTTINRVGVFAGQVTIDFGATVRAAPVSDPSQTLYGAEGTIGVDIRAGGNLVYETVKPTITGTTTELRVGGVGTTWAGFGVNFTNLANLATASLR